MNKLTVKKLRELLKLHILWLEGNNGKRLDLSRQDLRSTNIVKILKNAKLESAILNGADLSGADLSGADLKSVDLNGANLNDANLTDANLEYAKLDGASLNKTNLSGADLEFANLNGADLKGINLRDAILKRAKLKGADLTCASLCDADLKNANLSGANLKNVYLKGADLRGANLKGADNIPYIRMACPDTGSFIGWKSVDGYIIKLEIPSDAKRCSATSNKCRCEFANVLEIQLPDGSNAGIDKIINKSYAKCIYKVGKMVKPDSFDEDRWDECSNGIHFFINRQEAVDYYLNGV